MRRLGAIAAMALSIAACGAPAGASRSGITSPARAGQPSRKVLVLMQTLGFHHASIPSAVDALRRVAARDGRYSVVCIPTAARLTREAQEGDPQTPLRHAGVTVTYAVIVARETDPRDLGASVGVVRRGILKR